MIHTRWRAPVSAQRARTEREGVANAVSDAAGEVPSATIGSARPANGSAVSREARCGCGAATLRPATRLRRGNPAHSERSALEHPKRSDTGHSERRATESNHTQQTHFSPLDGLRSYAVSYLVSDPTRSPVWSQTPRRPAYSLIFERRPGARPRLRARGPSRPAVRCVSRSARTPVRT